MKNSFASKTFAASMFASGCWRGVGSAANPIKSPVEGVTAFNAFRRYHLFTSTARVHEFTSEDRTKTFTGAR